MTRLMKLFHLSILTHLLLYSSSFAQNPGSGKGSSRDAFADHTVRLAKGSELNNNFAGKKIRDVIPFRVFKNWFEIEFSFSPKTSQSSLMPLALKFNSAILAEDSKLKFASPSQLREWGIDNELNIDFRITYRFSRDVLHPLLGSRYIVLNVDSVKQIAYLKFDEDVCLFKLES